jgi:hypothetical protein
MRVNSSSLVNLLSATSLVVLPAQAAAIQAVDRGVELPTRIIAGVSVIDTPLYVLFPTNDHGLLANVPPLPPAFELLRTWPAR